MACSEGRSDATRTTMIITLYHPIENIDWDYWWSWAPIFLAGVIAKKGAPR